MAGNQIMVKKTVLFGLVLALLWGTAWAGGDVLIGRTVSAGDRVAFEQINHDDWGLNDRKKRADE
jgi:hypothetical protein